MFIYGHGLPLRPPVSTPIARSGWLPASGSTRAATGCRSPVRRRWAFVARAESAADARPKTPLDIRFDRSSIAAVCPPLAAGQCLCRLPVAAADVLRQLEDEIRGCGARLGIYGSLAWEVVSGEAYRHAGSDIDVVCDVDSRRQYEIALAALTRAQSRLACRLDGELRLPDGKAVAWPELAQADCSAGKKVLVKGEATLALMRLSEFLGSCLSLEYSA